MNRIRSGVVNAINRPVNQNVNQHVSVPSRLQALNNNRPGHFIRQLKVVYTKECDYH